MMTAPSSSGTCRAGRCLRTFVGHVAGVNAVAVTPDGRHGPLGLGRPHLRLWDLQTGQLRHTFTGHEEGVSRGWRDADGRYALSGSHDGTLKLWDLTIRQSPPITYAARSRRGHRGCSDARRPSGRFGLERPTAQALGPADGRAHPYLFAGHEERCSAAGGHARRPLCPLGLARPHAQDLGRCMKRSARPHPYGHDDAVRAAAVGPRRTPRAVGLPPDYTLKLWDLRTRLKSSADAAGVHMTLGQRSGDPARRPPRPLGLARWTLKLWDLATGGLSGPSSGTRMRLGGGGGPRRPPRPLGLHRRHDQVLGPGDRPAPHSLQRA